MEKTDPIFETNALGEVLPIPPGETLPIDPPLVSMGVSTPPQDDAPQDDAPQDDAPQDDVPQDDAPETEGERQTRVRAETVARAVRYKNDARDAVEAVNYAMAAISSTPLRKMPTFSSVVGGWQSKQREIKEECERFCAKQDEIIAGIRPGE